MDLTRAQLDQFSFSPVLYLIVPFYASLYFGMRASYWVAGAVALAYVGKLALYARDWYTDQGVLRDFLAQGRDGRAAIPGADNRSRAV